MREPNRIALVLMCSVTPARRLSGPERKALCAPSGFSSTLWPFAQPSSAFWMRPVSGLASSAAASVLLLSTAVRLALSTAQLRGIAGSVTFRVSCAMAPVTTNQPTIIFNTVSHQTVAHALLRAASTLVSTLGGGTQISPIFTPPKTTA
ncbi:hypothetical protein SBA4_6090002 [Candidatus Sulfopaludibacter sp. SbA4]|nr:hypothetical protein SBA4_6090002 [Candidatus Sulfopaludibacter sp. SbA4]